MINQSPSIDHLLSALNRVISALGNLRVPVGSDLRADSSPEEVADRINTLTDALSQVQAEIPPAEVSDDGGLTSFALQVIDEMRPLSSIHCEGGRVLRSPSGLTIVPPVGAQQRPETREWFWAKVTDNAASPNAGRYAWTEQTFDASGDFTDLSGGRSGTTSTDYAEEINGEEELHDDIGTFYVMMWVVRDSGGDPHYRFVLPSTTGAMIPCLVWRDGGTTDGSSTAQCDRTYTARTLDATGPSTGGTELGTGLTPKKRRPNPGPMDVPSNTGSGEVGFGYYSGGSFVLYDANETLDTTVCP